jgi:hypothetical protein
LAKFRESKEKANETIDSVNKNITSEVQWFSESQRKERLNQLSLKRLQRKLGNK